MERQWKRHFGQTEGTLYCDVAYPCSCGRKHCQYINHRTAEYLGCGYKTDWHTEV